MKIRMPSVALARAWKAVAIAAGKDDTMPVLFKTVLVEHYIDRGLQLVATDGLIFLRCWIAIDDIDGEGGTYAEPTIDELPEENYIVMDPHGRGLGLFNHVLKVWDKEDQAQHAPELELETRREKSTQSQLAGMEVYALHLTYEDNEAITLRLFESDYPKWRKHIQTIDKPVKSLAFDPELLGRIAKLGKITRSSVVSIDFSGRKNAVRIRVGSVKGLVMPLGL